jgi:hypothetical protein
MAKGKENPYGGNRVLQPQPTFVEWPAKVLKAPVKLPNRKKK